MSTQEACKRFGIEYQTAKNAKWVCETIERSLRRDLLTFHHHKEVAGRDDKAELLAVTMTTERKAGEMLAAMEKNPGNRNLGGNTMLPPPSLESLGITKMQSSRWQKVTP
jgi:hypothetical protein